MKVVKVRHSESPRSGSLGTFLYTSPMNLMSTNLRILRTIDETGFYFHWGAPFIAPSAYTFSTTVAKVY